MHFSKVSFDWPRRALIGSSNSVFSLDEPFIKTFPSAIKTKFEQHITNGEEIVKYLSSLLKDLNESAKQISAISFDESGNFYNVIRARPVIGWQLASSKHQNDKKLIRDPLYKVKKIH